MTINIKIPRKKKKQFKQWLKTVRSVTVNVNKPNLKPEECLEDLYRFFRCWNMSKITEIYNGKNA